jgi:hypothetical protein
VGSADSEVYANLGALGMGGYKCFRILVEGYRGGGAKRAYRRYRRDQRSQEFTTKDAKERKGTPQWWCVKPTPIWDALGWAGISAFES